MEAEFGVPQWVFGMSTYALESPQRIVCTYGIQGRWNLACLDADTGELQSLDLPFEEFQTVRAGGGQAAFLAGSPRTPQSVVLLDIASGATEVLRSSQDVSVAPACISVPRAIEYPTENGLTAHAFYYAPTNPDFAIPDGERPPLLVKSHGGPTSATSSTLQLAVQYWTSRGIAVLDVNYGGSAGFGREYRQRLNGQWGAVDVDDCVNGAKYLVSEGEADPERLAITGGSAGGYTTLCALTFRDVFSAGASYYGVSDLEALARDTHKFESRYLDSMIGPYPRRADLYRERSPIHAVDQLSCPVILLQGLEDEVVPPNQAEMMLEALREKGIPVAYLPFAGEQHGFRKAENKERAIQAELYFYARVFGFGIADDVEPIHIENMPVDVG